MRVASWAAGEPKASHIATSCRCGPLLHLGHGQPNPHAASHGEHGRADLRVAARDDGKTDPRHDYGKSDETRHTGSVARCSGGAS